MTMLAKLILPLSIMLRATPGMSDATPAAEPTLSPRDSKLAAFSEAMRAWNELNGRVLEDLPVQPEELQSAATGLVHRLEQLEPMDRDAYQYVLNRVWLSQARNFARVGRYREALDALDQEMAHHRKPGIRLTNQNRYLFRTVIVLEAEILGHLGPKYFPKDMDHFMARVDVDRDGTDEFVALERTVVDEEFSLPIPPLPAETERWVLYLLTARMPDRKYAVQATQQVIGRAEVRDPIAVADEGGLTVATLQPVTHLVELLQVAEVRQWVPVKYIPWPELMVRYEVAKTGFRQLASPTPGSERGGEHVGEDAHRRVPVDGMRDGTRSESAE